MSQLFGDSAAASRRALGAIPLALCVLFAAVGAAPPEIIRVHVPAAQATTWFPAGTQLRIMAPDRFESLLDSAIRGTEAARNRTPPRLIRAHHHARWNAGVLTGQSWLAAVIPGSGLASLVLDPWTPMVLARPGNLQSVGALESGKTVLLIEPSASAGGNPTVTLDWELRARPDSEGRSFALGLPGDESSELTLELPAGWLPLGPEGFREGPLPSSQTGFQTWRFHGRPESINLRLLDGRRPLPPGEVSLIWVSGPTRIMLGPTENRDARSANWITDWTVQPDRRGLIRFTVELDPGLEFIEVSGPDVKEYQAEHEGEVTRVHVSLAGNQPAADSPPFRGSRPGTPRGAMERARHASPRRDLDRRHHDSDRRPHARDPGLSGTRRPARAGARRRARKCERARLRGQIGRSGCGSRVPTDHRFSRRAKCVAGCWSARRLRSWNVN